MLRRLRLIQGPQVKSEGRKLSHSRPWKTLMTLTLEKRFKEMHLIMSTLFSCLCVCVCVCVSVERELSHVSLWRSSEVKARSSGFSSAATYSNAARPSWAEPEYSHGPDGEFQPSLSRFTSVGQELCGQ